MTDCNDSCPRRTFCKAAIGGLGAASAGAVGYPIITFLGRPLRLSQEKPLEVTLEDLATGQVQYGVVRGQQIIVLAGEQGPMVVSASCPHLGCDVRWDSSESVFRCPCHGAVFDAAGAVVSGPVNQPLKHVPFEIRDGILVVG